MNNNRCSCGGKYIRIKHGCCNNKFMCNLCGKIKKRKRKKEK